MSRHTDGDHNQAQECHELCKPFTLIIALGLMKLFVWPFTDHPEPIQTCICDEAGNTCPMPPGAKEVDLKDGEAIVLSCQLLHAGGPSEDERIHAFVVPHGSTVDVPVDTIYPG